MALENELIEGLKFLGPAGAASVITLYICKKYNDSKNGRPSFPCDLHKGLMDDIKEINKKLGELPMTIIQIFKDLK